MRIAVTGGAGFIGSHVTELLVEHEQTMLVLDDRSTGTADNLAAVHDRIEVRECDVRDRAGVARTLADWRPEAVLHLAAVSSVERSIREPALSFDVNVAGTFNMLEAARGAGARRFVFASSAAVYGSEPSLPSHETDLVRPASPYAAHKVAGELLLQSHRSAWGMETVTLRFFNVFGERQRADSPYSGVISIFAGQLLATGRAIVQGDGDQTRDFIYVGDVARALAAALTGPDPGPLPINVGRGESLSIRDLYRLLAERTGVPEELRERPDVALPRAGDVRHSRASVERMASVLGVLPSVSIGEGLDLLLGWLKTYGGSLRSAEAARAREPREVEQ